jgi:hypothetical protein
MKASLLKALAPKDKAPMVPCENFDPIASPGEENKQMAAINVFTPTLDNTSEAIKASAHVSYLCGNKNFYR